jgi:hypothetical protein
MAIARCDRGDVWVIIICKAQHHAAVLAAVSPAVGGRLPLTHQ